MRAFSARLISCALCFAVAVSSASNAIAQRGKGTQDVVQRTESENVIRKWTDKTGKFSIEARFAGIRDDKVVLVKKDGKEVQIPLDRLSEGDAKHARELMDGAENPFQETSPTSSTNDLSAAPAGLPKKANWREAKLVRPQTFPKWTFNASSAESNDLLALGKQKNCEITLDDIPGSDKFFESLEGVYVSGDGKRAVVGRTEGKVAHEKAQFLQAIDLAKGTAEDLSALPRATELLDVYPDQGLVMYKPQGTGFANETLLTIARINGSQLSPVTSWEPYIHEDWKPNRDIANAWFLSGDRVMTLNHSGNALTIWDVATAKALINIPVQHSNMLKTAFSNDRKLMAIVMNDGIAIIDLTAGRHVATVPTDKKNFSSVAFRDDARRLAGVSDQGITVWDLNSGEELIEFKHESLNVFSQIAWAGEYVLANHRYLYDPERRILLWEYTSGTGHKAKAALRGGRAWMVPTVERSKPTVLVSLPVPHETAIRFAAGLPSAEELLVVRPGDSVKLEVEVDSSVGSQDEIRQDLTKAIEAAGLRVVDDSELVVSAICKPQEQQTIRINTARFRFNARPEDIVERTITPHASFLEMTLKGESLWKRGYIARPGISIWLEEGETLDQALERLTKPNLGLLKNAKFSGYVTKPGKATASGAYGLSRVTSSGLIDGGARGSRDSF